MSRKTMILGFARPLLKHAREIAPVLLVSAAVLLVVEHWEHFDTSDFVLLVIILASLGVHLFAPLSDRTLMDSRDGPAHPESQQR